ncbi:TrgA family protein [Aliigemmobacter aestuarii]|uniref:TrgA family protein n=1 Tax=Aliigemmobacter aestuarii TaxID=1445661 RepID=A0A4S3MKP3_9RHOB|nr:TrgA family protein [Gemmobacter aestuarii]THD82405.1 TrgA family protein [Gemmobacter aestuarii]
MPTAAKLVSAVMFAAIAWLAAEALKPGLPEGMSPGFLSEVMVGIGLLSGWLVMGRLVGSGYGPAISSGVQTAATFTFFGVLGFAFYEMILRSTKLRYDGPFEAIQGMMELMWEYAGLLVRMEVLVILVVGSVIAGVVAEWVGRRWP